MNTFRNTIKSNYTLVPNEVAENPNLSWKAKGVFLLLASKPDDWNFYMEQISGYATDKMASLKSAVKELEQNGYLIRKTRYSHEGKFNGMEWILIIPEDTLYRRTENPPDGKHAGRETTRHTKTNNTKTDITKNDNTNYSLREIAETFLLYWNKRNETRNRLTDKAIKQVQSRLSSFTHEEIIQAIDNRSKSDYLKESGHIGNWDSFWRSDSQVDKWLNHKPQSKSIYDIDGEELPF